MTGALDAASRSLLESAKDLARAAGHRRLLRAHLVMAAALRGLLDATRADALAGAAAELASEPADPGSGVEPRVDSTVLAALAAASGDAGGSEGPPALLRALELQEHAAGAGTGAAADAVAAGLHPTERRHVVVLGTEEVGGVGRTATRRRTLERVIAVCSRLEGHHAVLIGPADADPDAVVHDLTQALRAGPSPFALRDAVTVQIDAAGLVGSARGSGQTEQRLARILAAVEGMARPAVVYLRDAAAFLDRPGAVEVLVDGLKGASAVLSLSADDHRRLLAASDVGARLFQPIPLEAMSPDEAGLVLRHEADRYRARHGVAVAEEAVDAAVRLASRNLLDRSLPGGARALLDEAAAGVRRDGDAGPHARVVDADAVARTVRLMTGVPFADPRTATALLTDLDERLSRRVVGQARAVRLVCDALKRAHVGIADPMRPLGSFLFLGPTGVGKTELARRLAAELFGATQALIRLDMGEYQESHSVARLVGAPPGYVGYGHEGALAEGLRRRPYSVVLLDEIEKAHGDVYNVLLSVLEEGRFTDGRGRGVDARHALIIMTSNLGGAHIVDPQLGPAQVADLVGAEVRRALPPEFLNRIDEQIVFNRLEQEALEQILELEVGRLAQRLAERGMAVHLDDRARRWLVASSYDPAYGARPVQRAVRRHVESMIARCLVEGQLRPGQAVQVTLRSDESGLAVQVQGSG